MRSPNTAARDAAPLAATEKKPARQPRLSSAKSKKTRQNSKVTVQPGTYGIGLSNTRAWGSPHLFWWVQGSLWAMSIFNFTLEMPRHLLQLSGH